MAAYPSQILVPELDGENGLRFWGGGRDGRSVSLAGDVNGDGVADFVIGAPRSSPNGATYVVFGGPGLNALDSADGATDGKINLANLDGASGFRLGGAWIYDQNGSAVSSAGDINGDGFDDIITVSNGGYVDYGGRNYSTVYVIFGKESGFAPNLNLKDLTSSDGFKMKLTGADPAVSAAGDFNGDGIDDCIISNGERSYVIFGRTTGFALSFDPATLDGENGFRIGGPDGLASVAGGGDINGDGYDDLVIGWSGESPHGAASGATFVVYGRAGGLDPIVDIESIVAFRINGEAAGDHSGHSVSIAGDFNADGFDDIVIGAHLADPNGTYSGASYVVFGSAGGPGGDIDLSDLDGTNGFKMSGGTAGLWSGYSVSAAGDFNGDGFDDIIVGAPARGNGLPEEEAYIVFGKSHGFRPMDLSKLDGTKGIILKGGGGELGFSVRAAGDVNGDGFDDVIVGAPEARQPSASGTSYIVYGSMPGEAVTRVGTDIANTIHGGNFDDTLNGRQGDDELIGHEGNDTLIGEQGRDVLRGQDGNDVLDGGQGRDLLIGGLGGDVFRFSEVADSTGKRHDIVRQVDLGSADTFDLPNAISGVDISIAGGTLSKSTFDSDLAAAADAGHLAAGHAVLFTPDAGGFAGVVFLVADQNGIAGYQAGEDIVVRLLAATGDLSMDDFI